MKKITTLLLALFSMGTFAQDVNIPDANFLNAIIDLGFDTNKDGKIQVSEAASGSETWMNVRSKNIKDLTGIKAFTKITSVDCSYNKIASLDITNMPKLLQIICNNSEVENLTINNLPELFELDCSDNKIKTLIITDLTNLKKLWCPRNSLSTIDVTNQIKLNDFYIGNNSLKTLDVSTVKTLTTFSCHNNDLTSLNVTGLPLLEVLNVNNNDLISLDLEGTNNIIELQASGNYFEMIDLSGLSKLVKLDVMSNELQSLDLRGLTKLEEVSCDYNYDLPTICVSSLSQVTDKWEKKSTAEWSETCAAVGLEEKVAEKGLTILKAYNLYGQEVPVDTRGEVIILLYDNGVREKTYVAE